MQDLVCKTFDITDLIFLTWLYKLCIVIFILQTMKLNFKKQTPVSTLTVCAVAGTVT